MLPTTTSPVLRPWRTRKMMPRGRELGLVGLERAGDAERRVDGPARVVLVRDGRPEQRHDAVAEELIDRALVAVHLGQHEVEGPAHEPVDFLGIEAGGQGREPGDVHEQHRHLLALALERAGGGEDLLGQVLRRVGARRGELIGRSGLLALKLRRDGGATLVAETVARRVLRLAGGTDHDQARAASTAELGGGRIRVAAARAGHALAVGSSSRATRRPDRARPSPRRPAGARSRPPAP